MGEGKVHAIREMGRTCALTHQLVRPIRGPIFTQVNDEFNGFVVQ